VRFVSSTYDQENRLIRVTTANGNRSEFSYDGMSRRVETIEYQANSLMLTTRYVYDGVLPLAELNGSMQGAGGIGGILATNGNEYSYDGNGNVRDIISASGLNVAHYEYDPFGNKTVSSGSYSSQPYQWSSKEFHQPSGMVYYLYRFYSPQLGRWINRDPIEEAGGINLYGFVGNDGLNALDLLGLRPAGFYDPSPVIGASDKKQIKQLESLVAQLNAVVDKKGGHCVSITINNSPISREKLSELFKRGDAIVLHAHGTKDQKVRLADGLYKVYELKNEAIKNGTVCSPVACFIPPYKDAVSQAGGMQDTIEGLKKLLAVYNPIPCECYEITITLATGPR
jgi:RHS repeat-associated protein